VLRREGFHDPMRGGYWLNATYSRSVSVVRGGEVRASSSHQKRDYVLQYTISGQTQPKPDRVWGLQGLPFRTLSHLFEINCELVFPPPIYLETPVPGHRVNKINPLAGAGIGRYIYRGKSIFAEMPIFAVQRISVFGRISLLSLLCFPLLAATFEHDSQCLIC
jgi:hypothetical protein